jgi:peptidyl-dipeptidase A
MGFGDYYRQSLALNEIDEARLFGILDELERQTDAPFRRLKSKLDSALAAHYGVGVADLRPWHYQDPFFQRPPKVGTISLDYVFASRSIEDLAVRTYDGFGLDTRDVLARSDLYARPGKDQHAFCIHIYRRGDVRILVNIEPDERWMETTLHELGHAVYDKYLGESLPFLLREPAHTLSTEAIAQLMGRLSLNGEWLASVAGLTAEEVASVAGPARERLRFLMLVFVRWVLVVVNFERALYADPGQNLNRLWWDLVERYQLLRRPDGRDEPDWAAKIHLALYPAYYQNYMLGELMASHIQAWLKRECGTFVGNPEAGRLLRERLFAAGASADWDETLEAVTGERLDPRHFTEDFVPDLD